MKNILFSISLLLSVATLHAQNTPTKTPWILRNSKITLGLGLSEPEKRYRTFGEIDIENQVVDWDVHLTLEKNIVRYGWFNLSAGLGYGWANSNFERFYSLSYMNNYNAVIKVAMSPKLYTKHLVVAPVRLNIDVARWRKKNAIFINGSVLPSICFYKWVKRFPHDGERGPKGRFLLAPEEVEFNPGLGFRRGHFEYLLSYRMANFSKKDKTYFGSSLSSDAGFDNEPYEWNNLPKWWLTVAMCFGK
jgi:hypothetical protein